MSVTVSEVIQSSKRIHRIGNISDTTDQVTTDLLRFLNYVLSRAWRFHPWDFSLQDISITLAADTADYTISDASLGGINWLDAGGDNYLKVLTQKRYRQWFKRTGEAGGTPSHYLRRGRTSAGYFKLTFWPTPAETGTVTGEGKKKLTRVTAVSGDIEFFPDEFIDVILQGMAGYIEKLKGNDELSLAEFKKFENDLRLAAGDEVMREDEEWESPPPDKYIFGKRNRGGSSVA